MTTFGVSSMLKMRKFSTTRVSLPQNRWTILLLWCLIRLNIWWNMETVTGLIGVILLFVLCCRFWQCLPKLERFCIYWALMSCKSKPPFKALIVCIDDIYEWNVVFCRLYWWHGYLLYCFYKIIRWCISQ